MMTSVLVVDHRCSSWREILEHNEFMMDCDLTIRRDGLEAYMELEDFSYDTVLIRSDLPGVPSEELVTWTAKSHPETEILLYGQETSAQNFIPFQVQHISIVPEDKRDVREILTHVLEEERRAAPVS